MTALLWLTYVLHASRNAGKNSTVEIGSLGSMIRDFTCNFNSFIILALLLETLLFYLRERVSS